MLKDYISEKEAELAAYNEALEHDVNEDVNKRRLTNIGTFRAYAFNYLKNRPDIHKGMTLLVRQLKPGTPYWISLDNDKEQLLSEWVRSSSRMPDKQNTEAAL